MDVGVLRAAQARGVPTVVVARREDRLRDLADTLRAYITGQLFAMFVLGVKVMTFNLLFDGFGSFATAADARASTSRSLRPISATMPRLGW